jgi:ribosomal-protein-alanine N-acetyltransferase
LLEPILLALKANNVKLLNVMAIGNWIVPLLTAHGFSSVNEVLFLEWQNNPPPEFPSSEIRIRTLTEDDLPSVVAVDQAAFQPLWRHSLPTLRKALEQSAHCTVLESLDQIIGYQISTASALGAHLARLAVLPARQGEGLGRMLVSETIQWMLKSGIDRMTVNTQTDNETSLKLYNALGFREAGIRYLVYALRLS